MFFNTMSEASWYDWCLVTSVEQNTRFDKKKIKKKKKNGDESLNIFEF